MRKLLGFLLVAALVAVGVGLGRVARVARVEAPATAAVPPSSPRRPDLGAPSTPRAPASLEPRSAPGGAPAPVYQPRAADEWQGMPVNLALQATCDVADRCGLAMACRADGRCGPCVADADCGAGEVCALDHCVERELAACRGRADCDADELCVLSGYSADARGNADLRASCRADGGGERPPETIAYTETRPAPPAAIDPVALMASLDGT